MNNNAINRDSVNSEDGQTEWAAPFDIFSKTNRNNTVAHLEHSVWCVRWGKKAIISLFVPRIKVANEKECGAESSGAVSDEIKILFCTYTRQVFEENGAMNVWWYNASLTWKGENWTEFWEWRRNSSFELTFSSPCYELLAKPISLLNHGLWALLSPQQSRIRSWDQRYVKFITCSISCMKLKLILPVVFLVLSLKDRFFGHFGQNCHLWCFQTRQPLDQWGWDQSWWKCNMRSTQCINLSKKL